MRTMISNLTQILKKRTLTATILSVGLLCVAPLTSAQIVDFEAPALAPTQIHHLPIDTKIRVTQDIVIPAYVDHVVFSEVKERIEICGKVEPNTIRGSLRVHPSKKERVVPAGSILRISSVEQHLVSDRFLKPKKFAWYKMSVKNRHIRYMTLKVHSKRWNWFGRWDKVKECGALEGFLAEDLEPLSGGFFQVYHIPQPTAIGNAPTYTYGNSISVERPKFFDTNTKMALTEDLWDEDEEDEVETKVPASKPAVATNLKAKPEVAMDPVVEVKEQVSVNPVVVKAEVVEEKEVASPDISDTARMNRGYRTSQEPVIAEVFPDAAPATKKVFMLPKDPKAGKKNGLATLHTGVGYSPSAEDAGSVVNSLEGYTPMGGEANGPESSDIPVSTQGLIN